MSFDSLRNLLAKAREDTAQVRLLATLAEKHFRVRNYDSVLWYANEGLRLSLKNHYLQGEFEARKWYPVVLRQKGDYANALKAAFHNLQVAERLNDTLALLIGIQGVAKTYNEMRDYENQLKYNRRSKQILNSENLQHDKNLQSKKLSFYQMPMATAFEKLNQLDSALFYSREGYQSTLALKDNDELAAILGVNTGDLYLRLGTDDSAAFYYQTVVPAVEKMTFRYDLAAEAQLGLARIFARRSKWNAALRQGKLSLQTARAAGFPALQMNAAAFLSELYAKQNQFDSAYQYLALTHALKDSLYNLEKTKQTEAAKYSDALQRQQAEQERKDEAERYKSKVRTYAVAGFVLISTLAALFLYRFRQIKHETKLKTSFTKQIHQIEMRALRAQMNPHFIFNCLNSINRYIVKSDHITASNYLTKFARLIRLILDNSANDTVSLDKEIQTLQLYVDMEVLRFDNVFQYFIEVDEGLQPELISIPSMLLQPYVENAIWHGLLHKETGDGKLWIRFRRSAENLLIAEIEDNGAGRQKAKELRSKDVVKKKSYGMQIGKDRIFLINELYDANASVKVEDLKGENGDACGTKVTVELPSNTG